MKPEVTVKEPSVMFSLHIFPWQQQKKVVLVFMMGCPTHGYSGTPTPSPGSQECSMSGLFQQPESRKAKRR